jgi:putative transposase
MIDRTHPLPVRRQCQLLKLARSTAYYQPTPVSETTLALMRRIDELHLTIPLPGRACCAISCDTRAVPLAGGMWPP